jgi:hypothetical protein
MITAQHDRTLIGYSSILKSNNDLANKLAFEGKQKKKPSPTDGETSLNLDPFMNGDLKLEKYEPNPEVEKIKQHYLGKEYENVLERRSKSCTLKSMRWSRS